ncbi:MAG: helix-turn-helix domain-containing protein, partial [Candidatus Portiera sp.]|nr:helix-turn-helix domain-containing protein [Portiera sp.]
MHRSCTIKLYPNDEQFTALTNQLGIARWVYNHFLALHLRHYRLYGKQEGYKKPDNNRLSAHLTQLKTYKTFLKEGFSWSMQAKLTDLENAFIGLWKHKRGFPNFKSRKHSVQGMRYRKGVIKLLGPSKIKLPKLGIIKYKGKIIDGKLVNG